MESNAYHFVTHWRVESTPAEIYAILSDAPDLVRWWPAVYLDVHELEPGAPDGVGKVISLYTKGWLPYTLRWQFRVTSVDYPHGFTLEAWGDFVRRGEWTFRQEGRETAITYDWCISAEKPLLRKLSWLLKPIFAANHRWAMQSGYESLRIKLARRNANEDNQATLPPPPQPTFARR